MSKYINSKLNKKLLEIIKSFDEVGSIILELDNEDDFMLYINKNKKDETNVAKIVLEKSELYKAKDMEYLDYKISIALTRALEDIIDNNKPRELEREEFKND